MGEYLHFSLKDALLRSSSRVVDLFRAWDEDSSGTVDKKEFHKAVRSLGFDIEQVHTDAVFDALDEDKSGALEYKELNVMLRKDAAVDATKAKLKRMEGKQADRSRGAKVTRKNLDSNYVSARVSALPPMVKLDAAAGPIKEQLANLLQEQSVRLIDLFREWDDDGNGALDKKEMRAAIAALGYDAPRKEIDAFFDEIDDDANGWIEFGELKEALKVRKNLKKL
jgi:Ca2+-binding EF-hand superfamily protein